MHRIFESQMTMTVHEDDLNNIQHSATQNTLKTQFNTQIKTQSFQV